MPRVQFKGSMLNGALPGSSCAAHVSGWMNSGYSLIGWNISRRMFDTLLNPWLLMMDDHTSYVSIDGINFAKANGILLVTFPPHCGHKLQPLDSTIYGPLKKYSRILIMYSLPYSVKARTLSGRGLYQDWLFCDIGCVQKVLIMQAQSIMYIILLWYVNIGSHKLLLPLTTDSQYHITRMISRHLSEMHPLMLPILRAVNAAHRNNSVCTQHLALKLYPTCLDDIQQSNKVLEMMASGKTMGFDHL